MKKISILAVVFLLMACQQENKFLIEKNKLGPLDNLTKISEVEALFSEDSVVVSSPKSPFLTYVNSANRKMEIYDKTGKKHLIIEPDGALDTISVIKSIRVVSDKYKTADGIGFGTTFGELKKHYEINNIQSSLKSLIISLEDINAFVSFDRDVLPSDIKFDLDAEIKPVMIPDNAEINRFWLNFENEDVEGK
jgi:hypothetical protein